VDSFFNTLKQYGVGRLAAIIGAAAGLALVFAAVFLHFTNAPQSLLYSNLDLKEASEITQALDQANIKYDVKGDGSVIFVQSQEVGKARMMLASKGLPSQASVGYELFDKTPALGQTEFVQNIDAQRALEGELSRTINTLRGISSARVHLVMPKRDLFSDEAAAPTASVVIGLTGAQIGPEQIAAIRNLVATAVPNLKPENVTLVDDRNHLLAAGGEEALDITGAQRKNEIEENLRKRVLDIVQGVVGPGAARVTVTADINQTAKTTEEVKYDPDGQVVRSTQTGETNEQTSDGSNGGVTAGNNIPGGAVPEASTATNSSGQTSETTNYEISSTKTTEVTAPGELKKVSVAVVVDDVVVPAKNAKGADTYTRRSAEDIAKIDELVRAAVGFDQQRGDQIKVTNISFNHNNAVAGGTAAGSPLLDFTKNDILRVVEMVILLILGLLVIFLVARPLLKYISGPPVAGGNPALGGAAGGAHMLAAGATGAGGAAHSLTYDGGDVVTTEVEQRIDMARIEGQVKASSVKKVSEFVERHPEESVAILRNWLHET
jgi:flagellar M-ring protein FliF